MQPYDPSLNSMATQGTLQFNGQPGPVISSYAQPPAVFYVQQAPQDNSMKMAQRGQLVKTYKEQASSFGRYCAMLFSFLSAIVGGIIAYIIINSDYWHTVLEVKDYASEIQDGGDILAEFTDIGSTVSNAADSCVTFATCVQICVYLGIGFAIYHGFTFFLSCCMTKQGGCVIFLMIFEVLVLLGSGILAYETGNNECNSLIDEIVNGGDDVLSYFGITSDNLNRFQLPGSIQIYFIVFAGASLLNALTCCCWNSNISQARRDEQELALKLAMIS